MEMGLIGLGKMGGNMRERLRRHGHTIVGYDRNQDVSDATDLRDMVNKLTVTPRVVWIMVPEQVTEDVIDDVAQYLDESDIIVDGGNTKYTHDARNAEELGKRGIRFLDCGVSGGIWGLENGYALMVGGDAEDVATVQPIFDALKPEGEFGFVHAGKHGAGHFSKMVHNGIEYAIMQAYAEGWELLHTSGQVTNIPEIFNSWRQGTVIRSWLLDLATRALQDDPGLDRIEGYAEDSGEGRWTVNAAVDLGVPVPTIAASLFARFVSRQEEQLAMKMVAAMRNQFGGHAVKPEAPKPHKPAPETGTREGAQEQN